MTSARDTFRWQDSALCRSYDNDLFFPDGEKGTHSVQIMTAKNVCSVCPVKYFCLYDALRNYQEGVWGGTTGPERKTLRRALLGVPYSDGVTLAYTLGVLAPKCSGCGDHKRSAQKTGVCFACQAENRSIAELAREEAA